MKMMDVDLNEPKSINTSLKMTKIVRSIINWVKEHTKFLTYQSRNLHLWPLEFGTFMREENTTKKQKDKVIKQKLEFASIGEKWKRATQLESLYKSSSHKYASGNVFYSAINLPLFHYLIRPKNVIPKYICMNLLYLTPVFNASSDYSAFKHWETAVQEEL